MSDPAFYPYTVGEAAQVQIDNRWRNGVVRSVKRRASFVEVIVEYQDRGKPVRILMDAASDFLRKHGEGKIEKEPKPRPRRQRIRYLRAMPRVR